MSSPITHKVRKNLKTALAFEPLSKVRTYFQRHSSLLFPCLPRGLTALHLVCMENRLDVLQMLATEYQATLDVVDPHGNSLLAWAKHYRNWAIAEFIRERTAVKSQDADILTMSEETNPTETYIKFTDVSWANSIYCSQSLRDLFRIYKSQTYKVINSLGRNCRCAGLKYGIRKGYIPREKEALEQFISYCLWSADAKSLELVLSLIPDGVLDDYFDRSVLKHTCSFSQVAKYASRLGPDLLYDITLVPRVRPLHKFLIHCHSQAFFSLKSQFFIDKQLKLIGENYLLIGMHCSNPCKSTFELLRLVNEHQDYYQRNRSDVLRQLPTLCLHDNGVLTHLKLLQDSQLLPEEKTSLAGIPINFIVKVDMLQYHAAISAHYCDYQVTFDFSHFPTVHRASLIPAIRLFQSLYPELLYASIGKQLNAIIPLISKCPHMPMPFVYYVDDLFDVYARAVGARQESKRKLWVKMRKHRRSRTALFLLYCKKLGVKLKRLPMTLVRHLLRFL